MSDRAIMRAGAFWDRYVSATVNRAEWYAHPLVQERLLRQRQGRSIEEWFAAKYLTGRRMQRGLAIGAGTANFELNLLQSGAVETFDLYDVSEASLNQAHATARAMGMENAVRCFCADVNESEFLQQYDLITFISSMHHVENLEATLTRMHSLLAVGGMLLAHEYVGPDRFAFPESDLRLPRQLFQVLDPRLKAPWPELPLPTAAAVIAADPTEAVHSSAIIETLQSIFEYVEITPLKTSLAFILWYGLDHDALYDTPQGMDLVRVLMALDELLVDGGEMPNYFAYLAASKTRLQ